MIRCKSIEVQVALLVLCGVVYGQEPDWDSMDYTLHSDYQAVDAEGMATFPLVEPIKVRGILLNAPEYMLDTAPGAPVFIGGQWQVFVQAVDWPDTAADDDDFGGTCLWLGQYIGRVTGNHPAGSYDDQEFQAEMDRLNYDPLTGHFFRPGDLVEVRARAPGLAYRGKTNINEQHSKVPEADFDLVLVEPGVGLPEPELVTLSDLKDADDDFIFDASRTTGCERYQGALVAIQDVTFVDDGAWGAGAAMEITDGTGRTFPVILGLHPGFSEMGPPVGAFTVVGIMDQEDSDGGDGLKDGYRLWLMRYDGSDVIGVAGPRLIAAASRRTHGSAGVFDLDLTLEGDPTVEPRYDGDHPQLALTFDDNIVSSGPCPCSEVDVTNGSCLNVSTFGPQLIVDMTYDSNACVTISVDEVRSAGSGLEIWGDGDVQVLAWPGNVNADDSVNVINLQDIKNNIFMDVDATRFLYDVNADGTINVVDLQETKNNLFSPRPQCE